jgi:catechol 2,3-dioxygenase-like lactoylglutathione lyase family enzyme
METLIAKLLKDFEEGRMNRRQLVQSLAMTAAAVAFPRGVSASPQPATGFKTLSVDHISYQCADYKRTRDFYAELMGMTVTDDNGTSQCYMHFGDHGSFFLPRNGRSGRGQQGQAAAAAQPAPPADSTRPAVTSLVDHIAFKIADWDTDRVEAELKRRGLTPRLDTGGANGPKNYSSFHVKDPDGWDLQISGDVKPGDRVYKG